MVHDMLKVVANERSAAAALLPKCRNALSNATKYAETLRGPTSGLYAQRYTSQEAEARGTTQTVSTSQIIPGSVSHRLSSMALGSPPQAEIRNLSYATARDWLEITKSTKRWAFQSYPKIDHSDHLFQVKGRDHVRKNPFEICYLLTAHRSFSWITQNQ